jgi:methylated-DNA-[protein]-cysteine S-methyltransferase
MKNLHTQVDLDPASDQATDAAIENMLRIARRRLARALAPIRRSVARVGVIESSLGRLLVAESTRGLVALTYLDSRDGETVIVALKRKFDLVEDRATAEQIGAEIKRHLAGDRDAIAHRPIDLSLVVSEFQRRALKRLRNVPPGSVVTYQGLAAAIGSPSSQRAIGTTMASNPLPIYVPCHRVIKSDGTIGNYGGGVARKLKLLRAEGFAVDRGDRVPPEAVYGHWQSRIFCRPTCSAVRRAERKQWIIFTDSARARGVGMRACKLCHPAGQEQKS